MKRLLTMIFVCGLFFWACNSTEIKPAGAVKSVSVEVPVDVNGLTIEQKNIGKRLLEDNKVGSIKHLYVVSAYSGQVLIYSTVKGKVTSSGKRLKTTSTAKVITAQYSREVDYSPEVMQDDGTYGTSVEYLYWWDTKGIYHQHFVTGGQILHISDQPLAVKGIVIDMNITKE